MRWYANGLVGMAAWAAAAFAAQAADISSVQTFGTATFQAEMSDALAQYRDAYVQSGPMADNPAAAAPSLTAFVSAWTMVQARWRSHPPPQYSEDPEFAGELDDIAAATRQAQSWMKAGSAEQAHYALGQVRALLSSLRSRNGIRSFADELDAFDDHLAEAQDYNFEAAQLTPEQSLQFLEQVAVLAYLGEEIERHSPMTVADDEAYQALMSDLLGQIRGLQSAVAAGQRDPAMAALKDLRRLFTKIWLRYGD